MVPDYTGVRKKDNTAQMDHPTNTTGAPGIIAVAGTGGSSGCGDGKTRAAS